MNVLIYPSGDGYAIEVEPSDSDQERLRALDNPEEAPFPTVQAAQAAWNELLVVMGKARFRILKEKPPIE